MINFPTLAKIKYTQLWLITINLATRSTVNKYQTCKIQKHVQ